MRLMMLDFQCTECGLVFESLIDLDKDGDPLCPHCQFKGKRVIGNPRHHKHVSHSQWRVDHQ